MSRHDAAGLVLAMALVGCPASDDAPGDDTDTDTDVEAGVDLLALDPAEAGPWQAGFRRWTLTYTPEPGETREIGLNVWYPTEDTTGDTLTFATGSPATEELGNATPAVPALEAGFPLFAYSHGDQGYGGTSSFLMRHLASHGWVAVAPDHVDNLLFANVQPTPVTHWRDRPLDVVAVVDALADLPSDDPLAGLVDTSAWVMSGHSRGGSTVWALSGATFDEDQPDSWCPDCDEDARAIYRDGGLADERVVASVLLATGVRSGLYGDDGHLDAFRSPWLLLTGTEDGDGGVGAWGQLEGFGVVWAQLTGGCHQTFALGACSTLDVPTGFAIVNAYTLAFARRHLLGDEGEAVTAWLDGSEKPDEVGRFERREAE